MHGTISAILRQKRDRARASIFIEGEFAFGVNEQTIEQFRLRKGDYLDGDLYGNVIEFDYFIDAKRIALSYLNYRARSEKEIRDRLKRDDISANVIERVIEFLHEQRLVHDPTWSRSFVNDKLARKPISSKQLEIGLRQKGISKPVIEETIAELNSRETDEDRAFQAAEKKWPRIERMEADPKKQQQKLYTFLAGRGFDWEISRRVIARITGRQDVEE